MMKRVSPLVGKHRLVNNGIEHDANANRDQRTWGKGMPMPPVAGGSGILKRINAEETDDGGL